MSQHTIVINDLEILYSSNGITLLNANKYLSENLTNDIRMISEHLLFEWNILQYLLREVEIDDKINVNNYSLYQLYILYKVLQDYWQNGKYLIIVSAILFKFGIYYNEEKLLSLAIKKEESYLRDIVYMDEEIQEGIPIDVIVEKEIRKIIANSNKYVYQEDILLNDLSIEELGALLNIYNPLPNIVEMLKPITKYSIVNGRSRFYLSIRDLEENQSLLELSKVNITEFDISRYGWSDNAILFWLSNIENILYHRISMNEWIDIFTIFDFMGNEDGLKNLTRELIQRERYLILDHLPSFLKEKVFLTVVDEREIPDDLKRNRNFMRRWRFRHRY